MTDSYSILVLMQRAQNIVEGKVVWKKFIDGTPLNNDIAVWMAEFARAVLDEAGQPDKHMERVLKTSQQQFEVYQKLQRVLFEFKEALEHSHR